MEMNLRKDCLINPIMCLDNTLQTAVSRIMNKKQLIYFLYIL